MSRQLNWGTTTAVSPGSLLYETVVKLPNEPNLYLWFIHYPLRGGAYNEYFLFYLKFTLWHINQFILEKIDFRCFNNIDIRNRNLWAVVTKCWLVWRNNQETSHSQPHLCSMVWNRRVLEFLVILILSLFWFLIFFSFFMLVVWRWGLRTEKSVFFSLSSSLALQTLFINNIKNNRTPSTIIWVQLTNILLYYICYSITRI